LGGNSAIGDETAGRAMPGEVSGEVGVGKVNGAGEGPAPK